MSDDSRIRALVENLLGRPWRRGAKGPDAFDCWSLVQHIQRELAGREVVTAEEPPPENLRPLAEYVANHPARTQWRRIDEPEHLCVVEMAHYENPFHVGVYLDIAGKGQVIHCAPGIGVTVDTMLTLRALGWRRFFFNAWRC